MENQKNVVLYMLQSPLLSINMREVKRVNNTFYSYFSVQGFMRKRERLIDVSTQQPLTAEGADVLATSMPSPSFRHLKR